ncbi:tail fiber domain-containing protein [Streptomyces noursei]|uniref:tail fiber domain-containing protein n=1 Tax=Streptomyces TaxID=1883 RepID=UPI0035DDC7C2
MTSSSSSSVSAPAYIPGCPAEPVNGFDILRKVAELPISTWRYHGQPEGVRHLGPMSQDWAAAFGLGETDKAIHCVDANGVALVAIQALEKRVTELSREVAELRKPRGY